MTFKLVQRTKKFDNAQKSQIGRMLIKHIMTTYITWDLEFPNPNKNPRVFNRLLINKTFDHVLPSTLEGRKGEKHLARGLSCFGAIVTVENDDVT